MRTKYNAFIFARGGSKGIPSKNLQLLGDLTLLEHSVSIAKKLDYVTNVYVSSDSQEILDVARSVGAHTIMRPHELATDQASEWLAWQHAVNFVESQDKNIQGFISLPCTAPLRSVCDVENAVLKFESSVADICLTITPTNKNPEFNMVKHDLNEFVVLASAHGEQKYFTRQSAPPIYEITTVAYVTTNAFIKNNNKIFDGKVIGSEVPKARALDIDDMMDLEFARFLFQKG